ncbi:MAG: hypothetical protein LBL74_02050 [Bacteroidales bacterium]|jgi:hypothetical protein|nr:hypothetical protein [Bacteroidales bacterium]
MRITKVKVKIGNKKEMVLIDRNKDNGLLYYEKDKTNKTDKILPEKKQDSFNDSVLNITISRKGNQDIKNFIRNIIKRKETDFPSDIKDIDKILTKKFLKDITFKTDEGKEVSFNLKKALEKRDSEELNKYKQWVDWYIKRRSDMLKKSISNNKINSTSKRHEVLQYYSANISRYSSLSLSCRYKCPLPRSGSFTPF